MFYLGVSLIVLVILFVGVNGLMPPVEPTTDGSDGSDKVDITNNPILMFFEWIMGIVVSIVAFVLGLGLVAGILYFLFGLVASVGFWGVVIALYCSSCFDK